MTGGYTHGDSREDDALGSDLTKSPLGFDRESAFFHDYFRSLSPRRVNPLRISSWAARVGSST